MKPVRLIKAQAKPDSPPATSRTPGQKKAASVEARAAVLQWLTEYQQQKQTNPREEFSQLFAA